jgi:hypothetical protein
MSEQEEKNVFQVVASMRALLQHAVMRVFIDAPDSLQVYKISPNPIGDHDDSEVSLDLLERDFAPMVNRLLVKSGLLPDLPFPTTEPGDPGSAGPAGEAVRPEAEPVSPGQPEGPAV